MQPHTLLTLLDPTWSYHLHHLEEVLESLRKIGTDSKHKEGQSHVGIPSPYTSTFDLPFIIQTDTLEVGLGGFLSKCFEVEEHLFLFISNPEFN